jgi:hypothetical protein
MQRLEAEAGAEGQALLHERLRGELRCWLATLQPAIGQLEENGNRNWEHYIKFRLCPAAQARSNNSPIAA